MAKQDGIKGPRRAIAGMAARKGASLTRNAVEKRLRVAGYSPAEIRGILAGQGFGKSLAMAAVAKLATRSVPGALLVSGGLVAKALLERRSRRRAESNDRAAGADDPAQ